MNREIKRIIGNHISECISRVDVHRYSQEPAYVNAVLAKIDGFIYEGIHGRVEIKSTIVNDRGPNSAEKKYGADFAITASIELSGSSVVKSIIGQAKKGKIEELSANENQRLKSQVRKMSEHTSQYIVFEVPMESGEIPQVRLPYKNNCNIYKQPTSLGNYITAQLIKCTHGDRRTEFIDAVQESSLSTLSLVVCE